MKHMSLGAFYQSYKQPGAFYHSIKNYRKWYPSETLIVVSDNGYNYKKFVDDHKGTYIHSSIQTGDNITTAINSNKKIIVFLQRFIQAAKQMKEPYFVLLEDDVFINGVLDMSQLKFDLCGCNIGGECRIPEFVENLHSHGIMCSNYYGGCGGSVFRTEFYKNINFKI